VKLQHVFDTNIVAHLLEGDARVVSRVAALDAEAMGIPHGVLAELLCGVEKSVRREGNRARLERFAAGVRVLRFEVAVAARYATVGAALDKKGRRKTDSPVEFRNAQLAS